MVLVSVAPTPTSDVLVMWDRDVVARVKLKQTNGEIENRLEQLRAVENRIKINVALAKSCPIGIDTMEDYVALKKILEYKS